MSPISIALNLLLAALLVLTLLYGFRLSRQLKALKDSHAGFADAVGDLDRAASRAESGLNQLRVSTDEAVDLLMGRIDKARELAKQLEVLTARAEAAAEKVPVARPSAQVRSIFDRPRAEARPTPNLRPTSDEEAEAAAEALILRLSESEVLTTAAAPPPVSAPRPAASIACSAPVAAPAPSRAPAPPETSTLSSKSRLARVTRSARRLAPRSAPVRAPAPRSTTTCSSRPRAGVGFALLTEASHEQDPAPPAPGRGGDRRRPGGQGRHGGA